MEADIHGIEEAEVAQAPQIGDQQEAMQIEGTDWQKAIDERDNRIAELEAQIAEAAKSAETAEALRGEIAELKAQGESDRCFCCFCQPIVPQWEFLGCVRQPTASSSNYA